MSHLSLSVRKRYWQGLIRQQPIPDSRLYPGLVAELRAALRDALEKIPEQKHSERWRGEWTGKC